MTTARTSGKAGAADAANGTHNRISGAKAKVTPEQEKEAKRQKFIEAGAVVLTKNDLPDMRLKEHRTAFMYDPTKTVEDKPDNRFLNNRPDLQAVKEKRGQSRPNLIFTNDGEMKDGD